MSKIEDGIKLDYSDVLIKPRRTLVYSRKDVNLERKFYFMYSPKVWIGTPIIAANMSTTGTFAMAESLMKHNIVTCLHKQYDAEQVCKFFNSNKCFKYVWVSTGITDYDMERLTEILAEFPDINICVDVANGYNQQFVEKVAHIRELSPDSIIMAGNVCTPEMAQELIIGGKADIVKVGIGPGSVCTTRLITGVGMPQLSAVMDCAKTVHGLNNGNKRMALVCADGGCVYPGDVAKAFGADADFVMLGGMFAGTDECEGEWWDDCMRIDNPRERERDNCYFKYYGMSSSQAQPIASHRSSEGKVVTIPYKGTAEEVLNGNNGILGSLRSTCSYAGVKELKNLADAVTFVRVNNQHNTVYGTGLEK